MKKIFLIVLPLLLFSQSFDEYKQTFDNNKKDFMQNQKKYETNNKNEFLSYKKAYDSSFKEYINEIKNLWPQKDISNKTKLVQYSKDYKNKKIIDYKKQEITLEVHAKNEQKAREKILNSFNDLLKEDVQNAYKNDKLENKIAKKLNSKKNNKSNEKIISDILNKKTIKNFNNNIKNKKLKKTHYKKNKIYTITLKMPNNTIIKKAKIHKRNVLKYSAKAKIPRELIYAIMHSESSFNPMARSNIPAYGLMQIVPRSAGIDAYNFLYNKKKMLSSSYLYNANNNIMMGSTYLHILNYKYLKYIKNPQSRLYCVIAAYNTGSGNVARAFIGNTNIKKAAKIINNLTPSQVYNTLRTKLPYKETRTYLKKVNSRVLLYKNLQTKEIL